MNAFSTDTTPTANFTDVDGRAITVRPVHDAGLGRVVIELVVHGATVRLSNAVIPKFTDTILTAALLGETSNLAEGNPTPLEK